MGTSLTPARVKRVRESIQRTNTHLVNFARLQEEVEDQWTTQEGGREELIMARDIMGERPAECRVNIVDIGEYHQRKPARERQPEGRREAAWGDKPVPVKRLVLVQGLSEDRDERCSMLSDSVQSLALTVGNL